jgi:hypothetical protein
VSVADRPGTSGVDSCTAEFTPISAAVFEFVFVGLFVSSVVSATGIGIGVASMLGSGDGDGSDTTVAA